MTGLPADHPIASITTLSKGRPRAVNLAETRAFQRQAIESTLNALESMHKEVTETKKHAQQRATDRINAKVGVRPCVLAYARSTKTRTISTLASLRA
jgi:hypothetical protein